MTENILQDRSIDKICSYVNCSDVNSIDVGENSLALRVLLIAVDGPRCPSFTVELS